jgi:hypothetical protein
MSERTGRPILESLRLEVDGEETERMLPESIVEEVPGYVLADT